MRRLAALLLLITIAAAARAQAPSATPAPTSAPAPIMLDYAPVLMLSDIHFDPFHDPAKVPVLIATPVTEWHRILSQPDSPTQPQTFADLQSTCKAKGIDTPMPLLTSTLTAAHTQQAHPLFITVSGDLTVHKLDCLYSHFHPSKDHYESDYSAFSAKIVAFVALELHTTFPGVPVYLALGNNDSGCKDYSESSNSPYLRSDAQAFADDTLNPANRAALLREFPLLGDANITLPEPFHHARLLILQDIFESKKYTTCDGKDSATEGAKQIDWLRKQLTAARAAHDHVWVMAHIPPGVDAYSTFTKSIKAKTTNRCAYTDPELFLNSELFANAIADFPDVINLVLLGHTHMDEMRLYVSAEGRPIPGKLVPSVTPVNGNMPSFTLATVDTYKAILADYTVYSADNQTGIDTKWSPEYTYSTTYNEPDFSGASVAELANNFLADPTSKSPETKSYEQFYFVSGPTAGMNLKAAALGTVWPIYTCSMTRATGKAFTVCACPTPAHF